MQRFFSSIRDWGGIRVKLIQFGQPQIQLLHDAGFSVDAAFDVSSAVIGTTINGVTVYSTDEMVAYFQEHQADVVLTIPQAVAQETVNHLVNLGAPSFWSFTNTELRSPNPDVTFENIHFADSLLRLSYQITNK